MPNLPSTATKRLQKDLMQIKLNPIPSIEAEPLPSNILEWHYVLLGPEKTVYSGGYYHGMLLFPIEYPFKAPSICIFTPNGRFRTNQRLCLTMSDFHSDTWNPSWTVSTILTGLLSFMLESTPTMGSIKTTDLVKIQFAKASLAFNLKNKIYCELFSTLRNKNSNELTLSEEIKFSVGDNNYNEKSNEETDQTELLSTNLIAVICFFIFALIVHYVTRNLNQD